MILIFNAHGENQTKAKANIKPLCFSCVTAFDSLHFKLFASHAFSKLYWENTCPQYLVDVITNFIKIVKTV